MTETLATRARLLQAALATAAEDAVYYDPDGSAYTSMAHADVVEMRAVLDALTAAMTGATAEELRAFLSEEADAAVEAEREACAVLASFYAPQIRDCETGYPTCNDGVWECGLADGCFCEERADTAELIAAAIRARTAPATTTTEAGDG